MAERTLTTAEAKRFYDRFGRRQDRQAFYEDRPVTRLIELARFPDARAVLELGCGTGRIALRLLRRHLSSAARYVGVDLSDTMVGLAAARLEPFAERARVFRSDGSMAFGAIAATGGFDRFLTTYVLDLLAADAIEAALAEAARVLAPGGLFACASLTDGVTPFGRLVTAAWRRVHALRPALVGGCRPLSLVPFVEGQPAWRIVAREVLSAFGLASEVLVAERQ